MKEKAQTEHLVESSNAVLWVARQGDGPPILLCNGGPGCCDYLSPVSGMLCDKFTTLRWEQRGCGRSSCPDTYGLETCIADMEAIREYFGFPRWIVGGHSWGANLALAYAAKKPDRINAVIFISGTGLDGRWRDDYLKAKERRKEKQPEMAFPPNMEVNAWVNASYKQYLQASSVVERNLSVTAPVLVIHAQNDLRPAWAAHEIANKLPNGRFVLIEQAEHVIWLDQPDKLRACLNIFLDEIDAL